MVVVVAAAVVVVVVDEPKEKWDVGLEKCLFGCLLFIVYCVLSVEFVKVVQILCRLWFFFPLMVCSFGFWAVGWV